MTSFAVCFGQRLGRHFEQPSPKTSYPCSMKLCASDWGCEVRARFLQLNAVKVRLVSFGQLWTAGFSRRQCAFVNSWWIILHWICTRRIDSNDNDLRNRSESVIVSDEVGILKQL